MGSRVEGQTAEVERMIEASAEDIWTVLSDGWAYASWVVGTARIRGVDPGWPKVGTKIHHSFGIWPALIDDSTEVLDSDPVRRLLLEARGWPAGEAHVRLTLEPAGSSRTLLQIAEDAVLSRPLNRWSQTSQASEVGPVDLGTALCPARPGVRRCVSSYAS